MANPSISSDNTTFSALPGSYIYGGRPRSVRRKNIIHETENDGLFVYQLSVRKIYRITFQVTESQLVDHASLDDTFNGMSFPFYFSISGAGASDSVYVRSILGFDPQELAQPSKVSGTKTAMYHVVYEFQEEIE